MDELLCKAFDEVYEHEFDKYKVGKNHFFSFRHRRRMKQLFSRLERKNTESINTSPAPYKAKKLRPATLLIVFITSAVMAVSAAGYAICNFVYIKYQDHTLVFLENPQNSPSEIECAYTLDTLPDGFREASRTDGLVVSSVRYENDNTYISIEQIVRAEYRGYVNTEGYEMKEITIDDYPGFYIELERDTLLIWDNGDYILSLQSTSDINELLELAKNVKVINKN